MKRFHVHVHVTDLLRNISFYSAMFGQQPTRSEPDYAKWMLEDPPVNFAISTRGREPGVDHLGIQVDNSADLAALRERARGADLALLDEGETTCCYARSDKYWTTDPQGLAWEQFHTLDNIPVFGDAGAKALPEAGGEPAAQKSCCPAPAGRGARSAQACC